MRLHSTQTLTTHAHSYPYKHKKEKSLSETRSFPCARTFAVCTISDTRQIACLPCATKGTHGKLNGTRQMSCLPYATKKIYGKAADIRQCRMFAVCHDLQHMAKKKNTRQNAFFAVCYEGHTTKCGLCRVFISGTRQICLKKFILPLKLFCLSLYCMWDSILGFGIFLGHFAIFNIVI